MGPACGVVEGDERDLLSSRDLRSRVLSSASISSSSSSSSSRSLSNRMACSSSENARECCLSSPFGGAAAVKLPLRECPPYPPAESGQPSCDSRPERLIRGYITPVSNAELANGMWSDVTGGGSGVRVMFSK